MTTPSSERPIENLITIMTRLRHPEHGCPWDLKQNFASILPHTLEEAYEVADAIEQGDKNQLRDELGDLLFQVIFYCQLAKEEGSFDFDTVCSAMAAKLMRRHPHVFGDQKAGDDQAALAHWESQKYQERQAKAQHSLMDDIGRALPGLQRAEKLQKRAANVKFDWPDITGVMDKLDEEIAEIKQAHQAADRDALADELGDLMFTCVNMARHINTSPEVLMRRANDKFEQRFRQMEADLAAQNKTIHQLTPEAMDTAWETVKQNPDLSTKTDQ